MSPLVVYVALFVAAIAFLAVAASQSRGSTRTCPACGNETPTAARRCRVCRYRFG